MRKQFIHCLYAACATLMALPATATAQQQGQAYISSSANLRAGPAQDYPAVSLLPRGTSVTVMGCVSDYSWCDVALPDLRGWVYAGLLSYPYQGNNVPLLTYGTTIGLPVVTFAIGSYWDSHYRGRPWYSDRDRWEHRSPPRHYSSHPSNHYRPPVSHRPSGHPSGRPPGVFPGRGPSHGEDHHDNDHHGSDHHDGGDHHGGGDSHGSHDSHGGHDSHGH